MSDERGYIVRRSVLEEGTRPEYIIPVGSADGVWGMIKRIGRFRGEGWLALWKGTLIVIPHDMALLMYLQVY
jgi:fusion and transport protein UGO1